MLRISAPDTLRIYADAVGTAKKAARSLVELAASGEIDAYAMRIFTHNILSNDDVLLDAEIIPVEIWRAADRLKNPADPFWSRNVARVIQVGAEFDVQGYEASIMDVYFPARQVRRLVLNEPDGADIVRQNAHHFSMNDGDEGEPVDEDITAEGVAPTRSSDKASKGRDPVHRHAVSIAAVCIDLMRKTDADLKAYQTKDVISELNAAYVKTSAKGKAPHPDNLKRDGSDILELIKAARHVK